MILLGRDYENTNKLLSDDDIVELTSGGWDALLASFEARKVAHQKRAKGLSSSQYKYVKKGLRKWQSLVSVRETEHDKLPPSKAGLNCKYISGGSHDFEEQAARASDKIMLLLGRGYEETNKLLSKDEIDQMMAGGWEQLLASFPLTLRRGRPSRRQPRDIDDGSVEQKGEGEGEEEEEEEEEEIAPKRKPRPRPSSSNVHGSGGKKSYLGVSLNQFTQKWRACIAVRGQEVRVYHGDDEEAAARAYDIAAFYLHNEKASLNFEYKGLPPQPNLTMKARLDGAAALLGAAKSHIGVERPDNESEEERDDLDEEPRPKVPRSNYTALPTNAAGPSIRAQPPSALHPASSVEEMGHDRFISALNGWVNMLRP